jgi:hypothetical protein
MFTVNMYCSRMMARGIRIGLVIDCTALDLEEFDPLPETTTTTATPRGKLSSSKKKKSPLDRRVRYFHNPSEWDDFDVEYYRLMPPKANDENTEGEDNNNNPLASKVLPQFFQVISKFIQKSRSSMEKGNSTTHISLFDSRGGLGVASYLAAAFMCHSMKAPVHAALDAVKEGSPAQPSPADSDRKWGLCDARLVKDLQTRYCGRREIVMEGGVPSWWFAMEDEDDEDNEGVGHEDEKPSADMTSNADEDVSPKRKRNKDERIVIPPCDVASEEVQVNESKRRRNSHHNLILPSTMSGLLPDLPREALEPVPFESPKATRAITVLSQLTQRTLPLTALPFKPELDISNITSLEGAENNLIQSIKANLDGYKVTWLSTKGRRGLFLILSEAVYFIEQATNNGNGSSSPISVSVVTNIKFPSPTDTSKQQHRSLLDVVLVHDVEKNSQCFRFYILDILCIEGGMVWHKPWKERWRFINDGLLIPRKKEEAKQHQQQSPIPGHIYAKEPIRIRAKEYFPLQKLEFVIRDVCSGVGHDAKGVFIIPMGAYGIGKDDDKKLTTAAVWIQKGTDDEQQLISLLSK